MHNKFAILDQKVWTGSFNWTISANKRNQENVVLLDEVDVCKKYEKRFEYFKKECIKKGGTKRFVSKKIKIKKTKKYKNKKGIDSLEYKKDDTLKGKVLKIFKRIKTYFT